MGERGGEYLKHMAEQLTGEHLVNCYSDKKKDGRR